MTNQPTVLVVEDYMPLRMSLELILSRAGFRVIAAEDGAAAVAVLRSEPVDIVLSDIRMPRMSGTQLAHFVLEMPTAPAILLITGYHNSQEVKQARERGITVLHKPVDPAELCERLWQELRVRAAAPARGEPDAS